MDAMINGHDEVIERLKLSEYGSEPTGIVPNGNGNGSSPDMDMRQMPTYESSESDEEKDSIPHESHGHDPP